MFISDSTNLLPGSDRLQPDSLKFHLFLLYFRSSSSYHQQRTFFPLWIAVQKCRSLSKSLKSQTDVDPQRQAASERGLRLDTRQLELAATNANTEEFSLDRTGLRFHGKKGKERKKKENTKAGHSTFKSRGPQHPLLSGRNKNVFFNKCFLHL